VEVLLLIRVVARVILVVPVLQALLEELIQEQVAVAVMLVQAVGLVDRVALGE
jgi:hypothetical protein